MCQSLSMAVSVTFFENEKFTLLFCSTTSIGEIKNKTKKQFAAEKQLSKQSPERQKQK